MRWFARMVAAVALAAGSGAAFGGEAGASAGDGANCDFDGDGYEDLAIGVPRERLETQDLWAAGVVDVMYGSAGGLDATRGEVWHQHSAGILGASEPGDRFGSALACGDFDGDGFADLAIGTPGEDVEAVPGGPEVLNAGMVQVIHGSSSGLTATGNQWWDQSVLGTAGDVEDADRFGQELAVGDFDDDGHDDLAIGVPWESVGSAPNAGAVQVVYGSPDGLTATGSQAWDQDSTGIADDPESDDLFGSDLVAGDFDGDGDDDLAVGVRLEDIGTIVDAGGVHVIAGSPSGLTSNGSQWWYQELPDVRGGSELRDRYGENLAAGDFDDDGNDDLAVGIPGEGSGSLADSGALHVMYGSASGLTALDDQWWDQSVLLGALERHDNFGDELAAGDFDGDGITDVAVGVPEEFCHPGAPYAGAVQVIYGSSTGLTVTDTQWWDQASPGILGAAETHDYFGRSLARLDVDGDGDDDLAVGVPWEGIGSRENAGAVQLIAGGPTGLTAIGNQWLDQNSPGVEGNVETGDEFGGALADVDGAR